MSGQRDTIKLVIMSTGEHIIGFVKSEDMDSVVIETPVSLVPDHQSGGRGMVFMPYLQFSEEDTAPFPKREIRHVLTPANQLVESYYSQYGAGIDLPPGVGKGIELV